MQLCKAVYSPLGLLASSIMAIALCILAFGVAYGERSNRTILLGTVCFGLAVFTVHFLALAGTNFVATPTLREIGPVISNETMAVGVILSSFVIFGAFLWVGVTYLMPPPSPDRSDLETPPSGHATSRRAIEQLRIPCEKDGRKVFVLADDVAFVRADGHYTQIYTGSERLFCVWPITEATKRLLPAGFVKVHRSYLVNLAKVVRFERDKDKGRCTFGEGVLPPVPVSRSHLKDVEAAVAG